MTTDAKVVVTKPVTEPPKEPTTKPTIEPDDVELTADPKDSIISQMKKELDDIRKQQAKDKEISESKQKDFIISQIAKSGFKTKGYEKYSLDALEKIALTLNQKDNDIVISKKPTPKADPVITVFNPETKKHEAFYKHQTKKE